VPADPRYDGPPIVSIELPPDDPSVPMARQRARLAGALADLTEAEWAAPSRCEGWSVQDVVAHLAGVNGFWALSITKGREGEPTRYLTRFDPVDTPAQLVEAARGVPPQEVLDRFVESNAALAASLAGVAPDEWTSVLAEGPPGHLSLRCIALHALWDSWVHERDVLLPLGRPAVVDDDEVRGSLRYVAALGPAFAVATGPEGRAGAYVVDTTDPEERFVVEVGTTVRLHDGDAPDGALHLRGPALELLEALSIRGPLEMAVADDQVWMLGGLARAFRQPAPGGATSGSTGPS
jgi:uncharacterized protein (TIGR03083 family)